MKTLIFGFITLLSVIGCNKNIDTCKYAAEPPLFLFQIKKDGIVLNDSVLTGIKISYFTGNTKKYITDISIASDSSGVLLSGQMGSFENGVFFIEYANSFTGDTLQIQNVLPSPVTNCEYKVAVVSFNNILVSPDSMVDNRPLYVFMKQ